jgi:poly(3-hydroxybutyrate) depolymerase
MIKYLHFLCVVAVVSALPGDLKQYNIKDITVSGISSGGFMAVQMHVAFSSIINGSAVFAGVF